MWYWMLPSAALTGAFLIIPQYLYLGSNYLAKNGYVSKFSLKPTE